MKKWLMIAVALVAAVGLLLLLLAVASTSAQAEDAPDALPALIPQPATLLPQAGVALGMCVTARQLGAEGDLIRNITLFAILIYELVGPLLTKMALQAAGEIHPMEDAVKNRRQINLEKANAGKK